MGAIEDYRARREARLAKARSERVDAYKARRFERLIARGKVPVEYRLDAPEGEEEGNNQKGGDSGGGHGNTRLPFGLCMRFGIAIEPSWGPADAWAALAGKGISPKGAFERLKKGEDPGTPAEGGDEGTSVAAGGEGEEVPEPPKEPVRRVKSEYYGGAEYEGLSGRKISWASRGSEPWRLYGDKVEGSGDGTYAPSRMSEAFMTKTDMFRWLKERGVEEFADPETGEIVNPQEMELPEVVFKRGKTGYSAITIGLRDGRYTIIGTDMDGKKKTIRDFGSLGEAEEYLEAYGAKPEAIKLSPSLKKREKERLAWLSSDKKEYFEDGGERFGDIKLEEGWRAWTVTGESADGRKKSKEFGTKAEAMKFLKEQGVQKVREGKETSDPQDFEVPEIAVTVGGRAYQEIGIDFSTYGEPQFYGIDLDGKKARFRYKYGSEKYDDFVSRIKSEYGISEDQLTISDESRQKIEELRQEEAEKDRRRAEFEGKAIAWGTTGHKYSDITLEKDEYGYSDYAFYGYGPDGEKKRISHGGDMYDMKKIAALSGHRPDEFIKDEEVRKAYEKYLDATRDFEAKATEIAGDKYADISLIYDGHMFKMRGYDERGRLKEFVRESSYEDLEKTLNHYGYSPTQFTMDKEAEARKEKAMRAKYAVSTGEYYSLGKKDSAFKDISIEQDVYGRDGWSIIGKDVDGQKQVVEVVKTWDDAVAKMGEYGVQEYKMKDRSGVEMSKPKWGMHKVMLMKKPGGGYVVYADSDRYGKHAVMYETPFENEAREWLKKNNVHESGIKTRGMNPNDDAPRTHTAKSLRNFDTHRAEAIENSFIERLSDAEKQETVDMLTDVFNQGAIKVARSPNSFGGIIENGYKSQIETGTGGHGAAITKSGRQSVSDKMYGHGGLADNEYEKCGYLGYADEAEDYDDVGHPFYGEITYTLKKDRMEDRTTYTFGDSLNREYRLASAGYGGSKPTIEGMTALYDEDEVKEALEAYRSYKKGDISYSEMFKRIRRNASNNYIELQFHGPVTVEDIDKVSFQRESDLKKAFDKMSESRRKRVIKKLKDNGVGLIYRTSSSQPFKDAWPWVEEHYKDDMPS